MSTPQRPTKAPKLHHKAYQFFTPVRVEQVPELHQYFLRVSDLLPTLSILCIPLTILISRTTTRQVEGIQGWWLDLLFITLNMGLVILGRRLKPGPLRETILVLLPILHFAHLNLSHLVYEQPLSPLVATFLLSPGLIFAIVPMRPLKAGLLTLIFGSIMTIGNAWSIPGWNTPWHIYPVPILLIGAISMLATQIIRKLWEHKHQERKRALARTRLVEMGRRTAAMAHALKSPVAASTNSMMLFDELLEEWIQSLQHPNVLSEDIVEIYQELHQTHVQNTQALKRTSGFLLGLHRQTHHSSDLRVPFSPIKHLNRHLQNQDSAFSKVVKLHDHAPNSMILGSPEQFLLILSSLLENARDACTNSPDPTITVTQRVVEDMLHIEIQDNGPGIPKSMQTRIFEPMVTTRVDGTGLGLVVSRDTARGFFQGDVTLQPSTKGACFLVTAPVYQPGASQLTSIIPIHTPHML